MTRATTVRAVLAVAVLLVSLFVTLTMSPRLGLDLQGGTRIVLQARDSATATADRESTDRTVEVLRQRIDALGVAEPTLTRSGENRVLVELPDVTDPRKAAEVLGRTAQLTFHPVNGPADGEPSEEAEKNKKDERPEKTDRSGELVLPDENGSRLRLGASDLSGAGVSDAHAEFDGQRGAGWSVSLDFRDEASRAWTRLTGEAACHPPQDERRRVAIVLDDKVISAPQVSPSVTCGAGLPSGTTQISGSFSAEEAKNLALLIKGGALPVPVDVVEQRTVGPTLGAEAISASARAAVIGASLTALFITCVYRLFGGLASLALAGYGLISYAALVALGVTLTLPGLAGFVLAIGMAVDANVLAFERAREEFTGRPGGAPRSGRTLRSATAAGFRNARTAVVDSNVTTLLAAGLLFALGSGPVKGFGVTLGIGVLVSMFSALVIARALTDLATRSHFVADFPGVNGIGLPGRVRTYLTRRAPDLFRGSRRWLVVAAAVMAVAVLGVALRGVNLGVEFTGGRLMEYATARPVDVDTARTALADAGFADAEVTTAGGQEISVRTGDTGERAEAAIRSALSEEGGETAKVRDDLIGPSLGDELRRHALIALGIAVGVQLLYLAVRFRWSFAVASVSALVHDVVILIGVFAWLGRPVDGIFLAALLTVIGYSVNDSVVVFDRVRELWARSPGASLLPTARTAVLQTVPRTVNTGMGALFILTALAVLGGDSLRDFALALLIGICVGTYSSVFTAVPVALAMEARRKEGPRAPRGRRGTGRARPVPRHGRRADNGARV
ncbi:bifunctional preprotein translocase subunit SecD/SecF [Streptomyces sp. S4.7]|uniref:protein translocase subunit SecD n=1 Tax=Streptomyces sp. S4.7 TaxID=2705439 RepID=UPI001397B99A|nr:protein translocase subunit SecD [Streptomyces sp. S4.7]QHY94083.1 bifunctional preprotein translocase subunit SecD/SecF [Streptomyces sp. S4.7]